MWSGNKKDKVHFLYSNLTKGKGFACFLFELQNEFGSVEHMPASAFPENKKSAHSYGLSAFK